MKFTVLGAKVLKGTKDGRAWDMSSVMIQTPIEGVDSEKVTVHGYGFEVSEMPLDSSCIEAFKDVRFPADLELDVAHRPLRGKFEAVVVGVKKAPGLARTA